LAQSWRVFLCDMKYNRLTREQFQELLPEFVNFLATQSIDKKEWDRIKLESPQLAEQELDVFSDLIWEGVLSKAAYLENSAPQQLFLFHLGEAEMNLIRVKISAHVDLTTSEGIVWLQDHWQEDSVELFTAHKNYSEDRNSDIFKLITQGAVITQGDLYQALHALLA
jgi:cag pathogenicity island protein 24